MYKISVGRILDVGHKSACLLSVSIYSSVHISFQYFIILFNYVVYDEMCVISFMVINLRLMFCTHAEFIQWPKLMLTSSIKWSCFKIFSYILLKLNGWGSTYAFLIRQVTFGLELLIFTLVSRFFNLSFIDILAGNLIKSTVIRFYKLNQIFFGIHRVLKWLTEISSSNYC